jgi:exopolysaccharide biosynthesis polyprenyl glycosylphosphotransferase
MISAAGGPVPSEVIDRTPGSSGGAGNSLSPVSGSGRTLRALLVTLDLSSAAVAWFFAFRMGAMGDENHVSIFLRTLAAVVAMAGLVVILAAYQKLYLARVCSVRAFELSRLLMVSLLTGFAAVEVARVIGLHLPTTWAAIGAGTFFVLDASVRSVYARRLHTGRLNGRFSRPVVLVGDNQEAIELYTLTKDHPESGLRVVGVVGQAGATTSPIAGLPLLGTIDDLPNAVDTISNGVIVASSAFSTADLNRAVRTLLGAEIHVHLSSGLTGISYKRLRPLPLAREPLFYIEQLRPSAVHRIAKRLLDIVLASLVLVLTSPIFIVAALMVKLSDRKAPVIYRSKRVGRESKEFTLYKLRSMKPDADVRLEEFEALNQRHGPLFKLKEDPRVTRVGKLMRQTSIDELPQLLNVLKGDMSMVGPRPALAREVAKFDAQLQARQQVAPGLTGLWQVEARDNPSFNAYRRLDLFYLENWSLLLDLTIMCATVIVIGGRAMSAVASRVLPARQSALPLD